MVLILVPVKPRVEVATQRVEVPVVWRIMPIVPVAFDPSRSAPTKLNSPPIYVLPATVSRLDGVLEPIPKFPACVSVSIEAPVEDATVNGVRPATLCTKSEAAVVVVPTRKASKTERPPWKILLVARVLVDVLPEVITRSLVAPTATNVPLPYTKLYHPSSLPAALRTVQLMPSGEVMTRSPKVPPATNRPLP